MLIKIKCPVCNAQNELTYTQSNCRRCKEDLTLLYRTKGYSYKHRLHLVQILNRPEQNPKRQLAHAANWLVKNKS